MSSTVIAGAGFGGIAVATELRRLLGDEHGVVLVDRDPSFSMGLRKLWDLVDIGTIEEGSRARERLGRPSGPFRLDARAWFVAGRA